MLRRFYPHAYVKSVFAIDYKKLIQKGYKGVIFDIDNTLVPHGSASTPEVDALFRHIHSLGLKTLLLSNNSQERIQRFMKHIDTLYIPDADKPNTKNYLKALEMLCLEKHEVIVIGDQMFSDILGANRCGIDSILVEFIGAKTETKLGKKRTLEKYILRYYSRSHAFCNRLGAIGKEEVL